MVALALIISGLIIEILGVLCMANGYLSVIRIHQIPWVLFKCVFNNRTAHGVGVVAPISEEDIGLILKGLAFLALGFILQSAGTLLQVINLA